MTMFESDFIGLPDSTKRFVERITELGLDRFQIHGLFVLLGLYTGKPRSESEIANMFIALDEVVPTDRSQNLDEVVGDFYCGYDAAINEFCFRTGAAFEFRNWSVPGVDRQYSVVYLKNEGILDSSISSINKLADASRLFDGFLEVLGKSTASQKMWSFQSALFFHDGKPLNGVNEADPKQWHGWVLDRSKALNQAYPEGLTPFSESNATLSNLPFWAGGISEFEQCDNYIDEVWGFKADNLGSQTDLLEYKTLMVHIIYAALTSSRETLH